MSNVVTYEPLALPKPVEKALQAEVDAKRVLIPEFDGAVEPKNTKRLDVLEELLDINFPGINPADRNEFKAQLFSGIKLAQKSQHYVKKYRGLAVLKEEEKPNQEVTYYTRVVPTDHTRYSKVSDYTVQMPVFVFCGMLSPRVDIATFPIDNNTTKVEGIKLSLGVLAVDFDKFVAEPLNSPGVSDAATLAALFYSAHMQYLLGGTPQNQLFKVFDPQIRNDPKPDGFLAPPTSAPEGRSVVTVKVMANLFQPEQKDNKNGHKLDQTHSEFMSTVIEDYGKVFANNLAKRFSAVKNIPSNKVTHYLTYWCNGEPLTPEDREMVTKQAEMGNRAACYFTLRTKAGNKFQGGYGSMKLQLMSIAFFGKPGHLIFIDPNGASVAERCAEEAELQEMIEMAAAEEAEANQKKDGIKREATKTSKDDDDDGEPSAKQSKTEDDEEEAEGDGNETEPLENVPDGDGSHDDDDDDDDDE